MSEALPPPSHMAIFKDRPSPWPLVDVQPFSRSTSLPADAPRLDDSDCPRSWTWPEGPEQTLRCEARGNPAPSVHCARAGGGAVLALGLLGPITRALAGTYRCTAANVQGEAVKDVTLTVECEWGAPGCISLIPRV